MEAPEKINISIVPSAVGGYTYITCSKEFPNAVEYTRTDTFIKKACEFLSNETNIPLWDDIGGNFGCDTPKLVEIFIKYMKEE